MAVMRRSGYQLLLNLREEEEEKLWNLDLLRLPKVAQALCFTC